jgi:hypothetical protein
MDARRFDTLVQTLAASPRSRRRFVAALIAAGLTSFSRRAHAQPQWRHLLPLCVLTGCPPGEECFRNGCCSPRQSCVEVCCPPETVGCERILGPAGVSYTCLCPNGFEFREDLNQCVPCGIPGAPCAADAACCAGSCCNGTCCNGNCVGGMCCAYGDTCGDQCCDESMFCCGGTACCPVRNCCGGVCCPTGTSCRGGQCASGCSVLGPPCPDGQPCCNGACCSGNQICCDGVGRCGRELPPACDEFGPCPSALPVCRQGACCAASGEPICQIRQGLSGPETRRDCVPCGGEGEPLCFNGSCREGFSPYFDQALRAVRCSQCPCGCSTFCIDPQVLNPSTCQCQCPEFCVGAQMQNPATCECECPIQFCPDGQQLNPWTCLCA